MLKGRNRLVVIFVVILLQVCIIIYANAEEAYKIGCMIPLSEHPSRQYGVWAQQGIDLAVDEINAQGGIKGTKLIVDYQDDLGSAGEAVKVMSNFVNVNKYPVVLAYISAVSAAIAPIARDTKTVLITNTYTPGITENNEYVFRVGHNAGTESRAMAEFCAKNLGKGSMAIVYVQTPAGAKASEILESKYTDLGGKVVGKIGYNAEEKDFRPILLKVKSWNPKIIYVYPYKEVGVIFREARKIKIDAILTGNNTVEQPNVLTDAGDASEGVIFTSPMFNPDSSDPNMVKYQESFKKHYGKPSEVSSATFYDTVKILAIAIQKGGYTADGIRKALLQIKDYKGITGVITFREDRDVDKPVIVKVIQNGKYVPWSSSEKNKTDVKQATKP